MDEYILIMWTGQKVDIKRFENTPEASSEIIALIIASNPDSYLIFFGKQCNLGIS